MDHESYPESYIRGILNRVKVIAMVGASANWTRPSYFAMKYLQDKGYRVIPVNPNEAGTEILGERTYATLADIPEAIDMVDCFRVGSAIGPIAEQAIEIGAKVLWMQMGQRNDAAAELAEAAGIEVVMNRCPKIEFGRFAGDIGWMGVNTRQISSKRRRRV